MLHVPGGLYVRGEVSSADAHLGVAATLYDCTGAVITLGSTQRLVIYGAAIVAAAGGVVSLAVDTDVAGARLIRGTVAANGGIVRQFLRPSECPQGKVPTLFAPAGQVDCTLEAEILDI